MCCIAIQTAPEVFEYSQHVAQSDVWAYGIVLWELFEYGKGSLLLSGSGD
jgi:hypothetical protein